MVLTGQFTYKIEKPLTLSFLDFATLALRRHYCHRELELIRRFSQGLYLDVSITGTREQPRIAGENESNSGIISMDLCARELPEQFRRFLNTYLEYRGVYVALSLLDLYRCYYALVRASRHRRLLSTPTLSAKHWAFRPGKRQSPPTPQPFWPPVFETHDFKTHGLKHMGSMSLRRLMGTRGLSDQTAQTKNNPRGMLRFLKGTGDTICASFSAPMVNHQCRGTGFYSCQSGLDFNRFRRGALALLHSNGQHPVLAFGIDFFRVGGIRQTETAVEHTA